MILLVVATTLYFEGYKGNGFGEGDELRVKGGWYTGGKNGCPAFYYRPGHPDFRGALLIANDNKPASAYVKRFRAVAARINAILCITLH